MNIPTVDATDKDILDYLIKSGYGCRPVEYVSLPYPGSNPAYSLCRINWAGPDSTVTRNCLTQEFWDHSSYRVVASASLKADEYREANQKMAKE